MLLTVPAWHINIKQNMDMQNGIAEHMMYTAVCTYLFALFRELCNIYLQRKQGLTALSAGL